MTSQMATGKKGSILDDSRLSITDNDFRQLRQFIYDHTGIALSEHKRALVCSRLSRRLRHHGLQHYSDYYVLLVELDPEGKELIAMINAITTNKTEFFREQHHFHYLRDEILPPYRKNPNREKPFRLWSAASSSGEEAYSLAMTALDAMPSFSAGGLNILATDIDTDMLSRAANGVYSLAHATHIPEALLHRYFLKGQGAHAGEVMAKPLLKSLVHFRRLNLIDKPWPMQNKFDVIFCRNVLIYFDKPTQLDLFQRMAEALKPGGYLMLGHSEAIHGMNNLFRPSGHSIYQLRGKP
ncbi:MAG: protein-glutamate O-methyltransferase CheR [Sulfuricaulis sp.]|nr:protein-glutamate O-methyltransferase CheR [Sulfuricaulis sp.]